MMTQLRIFIALVAILFSATIAFPSRADENIPGAPQKTPIALTGATIHTISGDVIENGTLLFEDGKITRVGSGGRLPRGTEKIDVTGKHIYPGMFEPHSQMGITEIGSIRATHDFAETGDVNPNVSAQVAVNPDNIVIPVTRSNGVLLALTAPTSGLVSGKSAVLQLDGWSYEDMTVLAEASMQISWPAQTLSPRWLARLSEEEIKKREEQVEKQLLEIRELFDNAREYRDARAAGTIGAAGSQQHDLRLEAMIDVVDGRLPIMVEADRAADIQSAVAFAVEQDVKIIILGGYDAELCAELLKKHDVPVIVSAVYRLPMRRDANFQESYTLPERLRAAGVKYCISGTDRSETWNARILPYHAATAVAYGLPADEAMKAITLYPAQILGVDDRVGSLEVGKDATLIVTDGNPLETSTNVLAAYIQGREVDLSNRQTRLYDKYSEKYRRLEEAK